MKPFEILRDTDDKIYKIRKILGGLTLVSSLLLAAIQTKIDYLISKYVVILFSVLIFLVGLILLLFSQSLRRWSNSCNKWFSVRRFIKPLDMMRDVEQKIYKRHRILGIISLLSAVVLTHWYVKL